MKTHSLMSRYRLLAIALTLALATSALVTLPAAADIEPEVVLDTMIVCQDGCWAWDRTRGCTERVRCCRNTSTGWWACWSI